MNQSEFEGNTRDRRQARENASSEARLVLILLLIGGESDGVLQTNHSV